MRLPSAASSTTIWGGASAGWTIVIALSSCGRPYLRELHERIDRLGNRERSTTRDRVRVGSTKNSLYRRFQLLSGECARDRGHGVNRVRHVAWRQLSAKRINDLPVQSVIQRSD